MSVTTGWFCFAFSMLFCRAALLSASSFSDSLNLAIFVASTMAFLSEAFISDGSLEEVAEFTADFTAAPIAFLCALSAFT